MAIIRSNKASDSYEWRAMNRVLSKDDIINRVFQDSFVPKGGKVSLSIEDKEAIYDICQDYYVCNEKKPDLYKKYPQYSKSFINKVVHKVILWWGFGLYNLHNREFVCSNLSIQDAYLNEYCLPKVYFGSKDDYFAQRTKYILSGDFLNRYKSGTDSMLYLYYIYGYSLDKILNSPEDVVNFYSACKRCGFVGNITISEFVSTTKYDGAEQLIKSKELQRVQELQLKIENTEKQISLLKDALNSYKAEKKLLYKSMDMEDDGLYVQTSFL